MNRITEHPVLGRYPKGRSVGFTFDGKEMEGFEGEPVAVALRSHGVMVHRWTRKLSRPRGVFCAIGRCTDCVMVVNGEANVRTCVTPLREGMRIETQHGAGAASGTTSACAAAGAA